MPISAKFLLLTSICCSVAAQNISTIAGGGPHNLSALQTGFPNLAGIAVDHSGNVYVSLTYLNQIWKVDTSGRVNIFAGNSSSFFTGDGGLATNASLCNPTGMAFDSAGALYVADSCNARVRKISTSGIITTVAGTGYYSSTNGDGGLATAAYLNYPVGVTLDSANNLYIADRYDERIRFVSATTGNISTFAGTGGYGFSGDGGAATAATFNGPVGVAVDSTGAVYIADAGNYRLRKVSTAGVITTVAGTGTSVTSGDGGDATLAQFSYIHGVSVDQFDDVFILESSDVREIPAGQKNIITFAGSSNQGYSGDGSSPTIATFGYVVGIAFDSNLNLYLADSGNFHIRKASLTTVSTIAGNGTQNYTGDGPALNVYLSSVNGLSVDNSGALYFSDSNYSIHKLDLASGQLTTVAGNGSYTYTSDGHAATSGLLNVSNVTVDSNGNYYFVETNRIRKVSGGILSTVANSSGGYGFSGDGGLAASALIYYPSALVAAPNGDLYFSDGYNYRVRMINAQTGIITTVAGNGSYSYSTTGDGGLATNTSFGNISSLSLDGNGNLFLADQSQNRIRKVNLATDIITTVAGNGSGTFIDNVPAVSSGLASPNAIVADQSGDLFISEASNYRVRKVTAATGFISTVAGNGSSVSNGDGGSALAAGVLSQKIAVDRAQNLYIYDGSGRIRTTQVTACFFTISSPSLTLTKSGGTGSVTVTATNSSCPYTVSSPSPYITVTSGGMGSGSGTVTLSIAANTGLSRTTNVALAGQNFTITQAGTTSAQMNVGFFQPSAPNFTLDANGDGVFNAGDKTFPFGGQLGAIAIVGDWNGDGRSKIGYYLNGFWALDYDGDGVFTAADKFYAFGASGAAYIPVVGDWNGSGTSKIGYYVAGFWVLDYNGDGILTSADKFYAFGGNPGETPLTGDWNGDKRTKIGLYYHGLWTLDYNGDGVFSFVDKFYGNFTYASIDKPVTGDWSGSGTTKIGVFRNGFWILDANGNGTFDGVPGGDKFYAFGGNTGDVPITADWNGDGKTKIGVYNSGFWSLDFNGNGTNDSGDRFISYYGGAGSQPIIGRW